MQATKEHVETRVLGHDCQNVAFTHNQQRFTVHGNLRSRIEGIQDTVSLSHFVIGEKTFLDDQGIPHDWRKELTDKLAGEQQGDGSWINSQSRWLEADPNLVTGYALLALSYCQID